MSGPPRPARGSSRTCAGALPCWAGPIASNSGWPDCQQLWLAAGTGTTLAGVIRAAAPGWQVVGGLAVPPGHGVEATLDTLLAGQAASNWRLVDASRGGFGRIDAELARAMAAFEDQTGIPLDPLYTGKLWLALWQEIERGAVAAGSRLVLIHSGGLQGRRALEAQLARLAAD